MITFLRVFYFMLGLICAIGCALVTFGGIAVWWLTDMFWLINVVVTFFAIPIGLVGIALGIGLMIDMCHGFE